MKKMIIAIGCLLCVQSALAQAPEGFKYQAVVRNASGTILSGQNVGMRLTIQQGSIGGTAVYSETFTAASNNYGIVNLEIGTGTTTGNFAGIDWANGPYFIETAVDISGGTNYVVMGTSQLMSVPYALFAKTAEMSLIDQVDDADNDPNNEIETWSTLGGIPAGFADGVDNVDDADNDPNNEIETWSTLGGIPAGFADGVDNVDDADNDPNNEIETWGTLGGIPAGFADGIDNVDDADNDPMNEIDTWGTLGGIPAGFADGIDNVDDADANPTNEIQTLGLSANNLTLTSGGSVSLAPYLDNTDAQTLTLVGSNLSISGGNSVTIPDGDITGIFAGDGLSGGGASGPINLAVNAGNGLNVDPATDAVELGGTLVENTTITQGNFSITYNLNNAGDFIVQDNGVNVFEMRDNGSMYVGNDTYWSDINTAGTTIGAMVDDLDDGRFLIYENGAVSVDLDANTQFIINEQGLDRDFRVESDNDQNALIVNAALDNVGIGTANPLAKLQVVNGAIMPQYGLGPLAGIRWQDNVFGGGGDEAYIQYFSEVGENTSLRIANNNDWDDDIALQQMGMDRLVVHNGNVGIGTSAPNYMFEVAANSAAKPTSNAWIVTSDSRLKKDIVPYTNGLEDLLRIEPVWFTYNGMAGMPQDRGVGVIAQDLEQVAPYMIKTWQYREKDGTATEYLGVDNGAMTYMLINAVKEQQDIINGQQSEIDTLKAALLRMEERMNALEKE